MSEYFSSDEIASIIFKKKEKFLGIIRKYCHNIQDAEDCFSDCCLTIIQNKQIRRDGYPDTYLGQKFIWCSIDWVRKQKLNPEVSDTIINNGVEVSIFDKKQDDYFEIINKNEHEEETVKLLELIFANNSKLTETELKILTLKYLEELKIIEISKLLNIPEGTVKGLIFRAIAKCRQYLDQNKIQSTFLKLKAIDKEDIVEEKILSSDELSSDELDYIQQNWEKKSKKDILSYINNERVNQISLLTLKKFAKNLGLITIKSRQLDNFFDYEIEFIKQNFHKKSDTILANILNTKKQQHSRIFDADVVCYLRNTLNLKREKNDKTKNISGRIIVCDFGHITLITEKRKSGNIKKARIKVNNKWKYLSHYIWEQKNGPIPKGFKLVYKDRNSDESDIKKVKIENLELISEADIIKETNKIKLKPIGDIVHRKIYNRSKKDKKVYTLSKMQFWIKVANKKYIPLMIYTWEQKYGKIPNGYRVHYKSENQSEETLDKVKIENMELIQDRYSIK
jgi:RNA polymerase sigma factor (sigma-70 family)